MKSGSVHHFIPTTEATSSVSMQVYPTYGDGSGSHLSVYAQLMRGEYDNELEWPFEGDIRVELQNWRADKNHHLRTIGYNRYTDPDGTCSTCSSCVTDQETTDGYCRIRYTRALSRFRTTDHGASYGHLNSNTMMHTALTHSTCSTDTIA